MSTNLGQGKLSWLNFCTMIMYFMILVILFLLNEMWEFLEIWHRQFDTSGQNFWKTAFKDTGLWGRSDTKQTSFVVRLFFWIGLILGGIYIMASCCNCRGVLVWMDFCYWWVAERTFINKLRNYDFNHLGCRRPLSLVLSCSQLN